MSSNCPIFPDKIDDFDLKYCIEGQNLKNKSTGRKVAWGTAKISPNGRRSAQDFVGSYPKG